MVVVFEQLATKMPYFYVSMTESRQMVVMDKFSSSGKSTLTVVDKPLG